VWQVTAAGAATQMVHLASLHHDEVTDDLSGSSADRSGQRWRNDIAILAGDYLLVTASRLLSQLGPAAVTMIAESFAKTVKGQIRLRRGASTDQGLRAVSERTGSLITAAAGFGAAFGGAPQEDVGRYTRLGRTIGTALQISDDVADITERGPDRMNAATDVLKRRDSLPVLYALADSGALGKHLQQLWRSELEDPTEALSLLRASPGVARAAEVARRYAEWGSVGLQRLPDGVGRQALAAVAEYIKQRHP
jgi:heptaprenyl diphosphate synthase